jgi:multimeric flavodoxin WrbA
LHAVSEAGAGLNGARRPRLLIVWHSLTGGTRQLAQAAADAAALEPHVETQLIAARDARADNVLSADGFIFATPENLAAMAGVMKDFFDRTYYAALDRVNGRPYATIICAGSDGENAARQIARIATGWRLRTVAAPLIVLTHAQTPDAILAAKSVQDPERARARELGAALAAGLADGVF